jgi:hypothetical protein
MPSRQVSPVYLATYIDVLDDDSGADNPALLEISHNGLASGSNVQ